MPGLGDFVAIVCRIICMLQTYSSLTLKNVTNKFQGQRRHSSRLATVMFRGTITINGRIICLDQQLLWFPYFKRV